MSVIIVLKELERKTTMKQRLFKDRQILNSIIFMFNDFKI